MITRLRAHPASAKIVRYGIAGVGPIAAAGTQFILSLVLLRALPATTFGAFSFLLIAAQFSWGLWSALFCAPLPILLSSSTGAERETLERCLFTTNLAVAVPVGLAFAAIAYALSIPPVGAALYGVFCFFALLRWFARTYAYASGQQVRSMVSDLTYAATLAVAALPALLWRETRIEIAYAAMALGMGVALLPYGAAYLVKQFGRIAPRAVPGYGAIWREHSGWSLVGVLTTEATANGHSYLITSLLGPTAFAPIAASALLIRPVAVAMSALMEFERAQMAREIGAGHVDRAVAAARFFRGVMIAVWIGTVLLALALFLFDPRLLFPPRYPVAVVATGTMLWIVVAAVRLVRAPESAFLQASGAFKPLARASMMSCGVSIVAVVAMLVTLGPVWSIGGIFAGELVFAAGTWIAARRRARELAADEGKRYAAGDREGAMT